MYKCLAKNSRTINDQCYLWRNYDQLTQHRTEQKRKKHRCKNVTETFLSELFRNSKVDLSQPSIIFKKCI